MKKIYRSSCDKILGGVCGGISEYFDIDPTLVRLVAVLLLLLNGFAFVVYLLAWIIIPKSPICCNCAPKDEIVKEDVVKDETPNSEG